MPLTVVVLGKPHVVPPLMSALHTSGVAATWAVDARQAWHLLGVLPGSRVVVTDDSTQGGELPDADVIDVRGVASGNDGAWALIVAPLIAGALSAFTQVGPRSAAPVAGLVVDEDRWCVRYGDRPLRLTDAQYRLLSRLVERANQLVHLQELAQHMFDSSHCERQRIHAHVKRLRVRLLEETDGRFAIVAVRGLGYRLSDNDPGALRSAG